MVGPVVNPHHFRASLNTKQGELEMDDGQIATKTLEQYRDEFKQKKLITMPLSGTIIWASLAIMATQIPDQQMVLPMYIGTGSIFYLALLLSKFTGETLIAKKADRNPFDSLFLYTVVMSLMVFAIAMPFAALDHTSIPLSIGILSGLMWLPLSWIIEHKVGVIHTFVRTSAIVTVWLLLPEQRFVAVPAVIVCIYLVSLYQLHQRWSALNTPVVRKPVSH